MWKDVITEIKIRTYWSVEESINRRERNQKPVIGKIYPNRTPRAQTPRTKRGAQRDPRRARRRVNTTKQGSRARLHANDVTMWGRRTMYRKNTKTKLRHPAPARTWGTSNPARRRGDCSAVRPLWKTLRWLLAKLNTPLAYNPAMARRRWKLTSSQKPARGCARTLSS